MCRPVIIKQMWSSLTARSPWSMNRISPTGWTSLLYWINCATKASLRGITIPMWAWSILIIHSLLQQKSQKMCNDEIERSPRRFKHWSISFKRIHSLLPMMLLVTTFNYGRATPNLVHMLIFGYGFLSDKRIKRFSSGLLIQRFATILGPRHRSFHCVQAPGSINPVSLRSILTASARRNIRFSPATILNREPSALIVFIISSMADFSIDTKKESSSRSRSYPHPYLCFFKSHSRSRKRAECRRSLAWFRVENTSNRAQCFDSSKFSVDSDRVGDLALTVSDKHVGDQRDGLGMDRLGDGWIGSSEQLHPRNRLHHHWFSSDGPSRR